MQRFERLDSLGVELGYFSLPRAAAGFETVTYYLLTDASVEDVHRLSHWTILMVGTTVRNPRELVLRQIQIESEALEHPLFNGWTDSGGLQTFTYSGLLALRDFICMLAGQISDPSVQVSNHTYFADASSANYAACGIPTELLNRFAYRFHDTEIYQYQPDVITRNDGACSFIRISQWTRPSHPLSPPMVFVALETYTGARIAAIQHDWAQYQRNQSVHLGLDVQMMHGESAMHCSRGGLLALGSLLDGRLQTLLPGSTI